MVHSQILRVHAAAVAARLTGDRDALLAGIPGTLTASFPTASNPSAQLLGDLDRLNDVGTLPDGSVPLQTWLANAETLSGPRVEATIFRQVLDSAKSPPVSAALPALPPSSKPVPVPAGILQSTFISYGAPDQAFAERLDAALRRHGVKTFLFTRDAVPGQKLHRAMRQGVNQHDRVILICSEKSLGRPGVRNEIEETLTREARDGGASYLIPITLDDFVFSGWSPPDPGTAQAVRDRVVADFRGAEADQVKFEADVARLVSALAVSSPDPLPEADAVPHGKKDDHATQSSWRTIFTRLWYVALTLLVGSGAGVVPWVVFKKSTGPQSSSASEGSSTRGVVGTPKQAVADEKLVPDKTQVKGFFGSTCTQSNSGVFAYCSDESMGDCEAKLAASPAGPVKANHKCVARPVEAWCFRYRSTDDSFRDVCSGTGSQCDSLRSGYRQVPTIKAVGDTCVRVNL